MNLSANINHNSKNIFINAHDAVNPNEIEIEIEIEVFAGDAFGSGNLSMFVPMKSAKRVTEKYLKMCGQRLIDAQVWDY